MIHSSDVSQYSTADTLINFYCKAKEGKDVNFQYFSTVVNLCTFVVISGLKFLQASVAWHKVSFSTAPVKFCSPWYQCNASITSVF